MSKRAVGRVIGNVEGEEATMTNIRVAVHAIILMHLIERAASYARRRCSRRPSRVFEAIFTSDRPEIHRSKTLR